jgi:hypothetical protein
MTETVNSRRFAKPPPRIEELGSTRAAVAATGQTLLARKTSAHLQLAVDGLEFTPRCQAVHKGACFCVDV